MIQMACDFTRECKSLKIRCQQTLQSLHHPPWQANSSELGLTFENEFAPGWGETNLWEKEPWESAKLPWPTHSFQDCKKKSYPELILKGLTFVANCHEMRVFCAIFLPQYLRSRNFFGQISSLLMQRMCNVWCVVRWTYGGVYINHQTEGLIPGKSAMGWVGRGLMWELGGVSKEGQYLFSPDPFLFIEGENAIWRQPGGGGNFDY